MFNFLVPILLLYTSQGMAWQVEKSPCWLAFNLVRSVSSVFGLLESEHASNFTNLSLSASIFETFLKIYKKKNVSVHIFVCIPLAIPTIFVHTRLLSLFMWSYQSNQLKQSNN